MNINQDRATSTSFAFGNAISHLIAQGAQLKFLTSREDDETVGSEGKKDKVRIKTETIFLKAPTRFDGIWFLYKEVHGTLTPGGFCREEELILCTAEPRMRGTEVATSDADPLLYGEMIASAKLLADESGKIKDIQVLFTATIHRPLVGPKAYAFTRTALRMIEMFSRDARMQMDS